MSVCLRRFAPYPGKSSCPRNSRSSPIEIRPCPLLRARLSPSLSSSIHGLGLRGQERVLDIGTGSGYAAAVLSRVAKEVFTVERVEALAEAAQARLTRLGYTNVHVLCADGTLGWPEHAPYEAIAVAAGGPEVPAALRSQLSLGGRMVLPVGSQDSQSLVRVTRESESRFTETALTPVRFVPLIGAQGWPEEKAAPARPVVETGGPSASN
jgi:protein-L-isoaspartate(D-aspartate) O-methyltransferase